MIPLYHLNYLTAGLIYLPSGVGGVLSAFTSGKVTDCDYRITARIHGFPTEKGSDTPSNFPFEKARLRSVFPLLKDQYYGYWKIRLSTTSENLRCCPTAYAVHWWKVASCYFHHLWDIDHGLEPWTGCDGSGKPQFDQMYAQCSGHRDPSGAR